MSIKLLWSTTLVALKRTALTYRASALIYALTSLISFTALAFVMQLWKSDLSIPFYPLAGDTLAALSCVKFVCNSYSLTFTPYLGAPYGLPLVQFPGIQGLTNGITRFLHLFASDPLEVANLLYIGTFVLTALTALFVYRSQRISNYIAVPLSVLYSLLPYHFYRNDAHLNLSSYFLVPLVILLCIWVSRDESLINFGARIQWRAYRLLTHKGVLALFICVLIALSDIYYAFFACYFILVAALVDLTRPILFKRLVTLAVLVGVISISAGLYLAPSLYAVASHQEAGAIPHRDIAHSQVFALKLASMILPLREHRVSVLAQLRQTYEEHSVTSNVESDGGTLGIIGVIGLVVLLSQAFQLHRSDRELLYRALYVLFLFGVLLATVAGLSSLLRVTGFSMIRAWGRIVPYLAFCCFLAVGLWADGWTKTLPARLGKRLGYGAVSAIILCGFTAGVLDQTSTTWQFVPRYPDLKTDYDSARQFTAALEETVDSGAMIYQLPYAPFFEAGPINGMNDYSHLVPLLFSQRGLKWSYGALRGSAGEALALRLNALPVPQLLEGLSANGFQGLYIDRWGVGAKDAELEAGLALALHKMPIVSADKRRAFFSLRDFVPEGFTGKSADEVKKLQSGYQKLLAVNWDQGCYGMEGVADAYHRWCSASSQVALTNPAANPVQAEFKMAAFTGDAEPSRVWFILPSGARKEFTVSSAGIAIKLQDTIPPGVSSLRISTTAHRVNAPSDPRELYIRLGGFQVWSNGSRIY